LHDTTPNHPWPSSIDDLRAEPGRLVFESDLRRLRIIKHHGMIKRLPKPLRVPAEPYGWEARTILRALGIDLGGPTSLPRRSNAVDQVSNAEHAHRAAQGECRGPLTVSFTDTESSQVAALAEQLDMPVTAVVRRAIADYAAQFPQQKSNEMEDEMTKST
jgi:hypothetical protein